MQVPVLKKSADMWFDKNAHGIGIFPKQVPLSKRINSLAMDVIGQYTWKRPYSCNDNYILEHACDQVGTIENYANFY